MHICLQKALWYLTAKMFTLFRYPLPIYLINESFFLMGSGKGGSPLRQFVDSPFSHVRMDLAPTTLLYQEIKSPHNLCRVYHLELGVFSLVLLKHVWQCLAGTPQLSVFQTQEKEESASSHSSMRRCAELVALLTLPRLTNRGGTDAQYWGSSSLCE